jgi:hypothetical protein
MFIPSKSRSHRSLLGVLTSSPGISRAPITVGEGGHVPT